MGILTEHVRRRLDEDVRSRGLLVWLDKEGDWTPLVDRWMTGRL